MGERPISSLVEIVTERGLLLKELSIDDTDKLLNLFRANHEELIKAHIHSPKTALEIVEKITYPWPEGRKDFGIWHADQLIGEVDIIPRHPLHAEIVYWIDRDHRGNDYASDAVAAAAEYSAAALNQPILRAWADLDNLASRKTLTKAGFSPSTFNPSGRVVCYELNKNT